MASDPVVHFEAEIQIRGINPYVLVPADTAGFLKKGWKRPMPVCVKVNGIPDEPWHINLMPIGDGSFFLYLHGDIRKVSGTQVGDSIGVAIWFDVSYHGGPMMPMPEKFKRALDGSPQARGSWDALTPSRQKEIIRYLDGLKTDEALIRNITKVMSRLSGDAGTYMGRKWSGGN